MKLSMTEKFGMTGPEIAWLVPGACLLIAAIWWLGSWVYNLVA